MHPSLLTCLCTSRSCLKYFLSVAVVDVAVDGVVVVVGVVVAAATVADFAVVVSSLFRCRFCFTACVGVSLLVVL